MIRVAGLISSRWWRVETISVRIGAIFAVGCTARPPYRPLILAFAPLLSYMLS